VTVRADASFRHGAVEGLDAAVGSPPAHVRCGNDACGSEPSPLHSR
jgi:hypothetical protein